MIPQLQRQTTMAAPESAADNVTQWSIPAKIAFRFGFSYFLLYVYPRAVGSLAQTRRVCRRQRRRQQPRRPVFSGRE